MQKWQLISPPSQLFSSIPAQAINQESNVVSFFSGYDEPAYKRQRASIVPSSPTCKPSQLLRYLHKPRWETACRQIVHVQRKQIFQFFFLLHICLDCWRWDCGFSKCSTLLVAFCAGAPIISLDLLSFPSRKSLFSQNSAPHVGAASQACEIKPLQNICLSSNLQNGRANLATELFHKGVKSIGRVKKVVNKSFDKSSAHVEAWSQGCEVKHLQNRDWFLLRGEKSPLPFIENWNIHKFSEGFILILFKMPCLLKFCENIPNEIHQAREALASADSAPSTDWAQIVLIICEQILIVLFAEKYVVQGGGGMARRPKPVLIWQIVCQLRPCPLHHLDNSHLAEILFWKRYCCLKKASSPTSHFSSHRASTPCIVCRCWAVVELAWLWYSFREVRNRKETESSLVPCARPSPSYSFNIFCFPCDAGVGSHLQGRFIFCENACYGSFCRLELCSTSLLCCCQWKESCLHSFCELPKHLKEAVSWWQTRDRNCLLCQCNWCKAAKSGHYIIGPAARPRVGQIQAKSENFAAGRRTAGGESAGSTKKILTSRCLVPNSYCSPTNAGPHGPSVAR